MGFVKCHTDSGPVEVIIFSHTEALKNDIQQLITSRPQFLYAYCESLKQIHILEHIEAFFIEVSAAQHLNESLELIKHIRLTNQAACIFVLVTYAKSFSSINYYLNGADNCLKLPVDSNERKALLKRTIHDSPWKTPYRLILDRTRLYLSYSAIKVEISYTEMVILSALLKAPQYVLSQDEIAKALDPNVVFYDPRALEKPLAV